MPGYLIKKLGRLLLVLIGVSLIAFGMTYWIQGNPAELVLAQTGVDPTQEEIERMEHQLGLDRSLPEQYLTWIEKVLQGDFGTSYITGVPVKEELAYRVPATLKLTIGAFLVTLGLAVPLGIWSAVQKDKLPDVLTRGAASMGLAVPGFIWGLLLCYWFSVRLGLLPMTGEQTFARLVLPVLTLSLPLTSRYICVIRGCVLEQLEEGYVFLLRSKGLREQTILWGNVLKNAAVPVVSLLGLSLGSLLGGSVVVESLFSWPGLGSYLITSINNRDYPVITAYVLLMAVAFVLINGLADLLLCLLDPRIRLGGGRQT